MNRGWSNFLRKSFIAAVATLPVVSAVAAGLPQYHAPDATLPRALAGQITHKIRHPAPFSARVLGELAKLSSSQQNAYLRLTKAFDDGVSERRRARRGKGESDDPRRVPLAEITSANAFAHAHLVTGAAVHDAPPDLPQPGFRLVFPALSLQTPEICA